MGVAGVNCQVGGGESRLEADAVWQRDIVQNGYTLSGVGGVGGKHTGLQVIGKRGQLIIATANKTDSSSACKQVTVGGGIIHVWDLSYFEQKPTNTPGFSLIVACTLLHFLHLLTAQSSK